MSSRDRDFRPSRRRGFDDDNFETPRRSFGSTPGSSAQKFEAPSGPAQFLEWYKTPAPHDGYIEWLRREHEKLHRKPVPMPPQTNYAKGSMEWFQQQEELRRHRQGN